MARVGAFYPPPKKRGGTFCPYGKDSLTGLLGAPNPNGMTEITNIMNLSARIRSLPPLLLFCLSCLGSLAHASTRPNIVFILADDLDVTTSEYWERATAAGKDDPLKKTRALIKQRGITFNNTFAPTPICCPARSTMLTGKLGHNTGVLTNGGDQGGWHTFVRNGNEQQTIAVMLQQAGYRTALIGKYLNGISDAATHVPPGWSEWYGFVDPRLGEYIGYDYDVNENGTIKHYGNAAEDYSTDVVADKAVDFIRRAESDDEQPFFLFVSPTAPHLPLKPAPRHANNPYADAKVPTSPNFQEDDISDKSWWLRASGLVRKAEVAVWNPIDYRNRQGSLYALDDLVAKVVASLDAAGELDNTYLIFTSDNGYNLGAHRLLHKMAPYEESIRVPLAIAGPGIPAGLARSQFVLETDFAPTFAQWAGLPVPATMDGRSLLPLLGATQPSSWRKDFLLQYAATGVANGIGAELPPVMWYLSGYDIPTYRALRNDKYLFVEFYDKEKFPNVHEHELYDLQGDKYQMNNLVSDWFGRQVHRQLTEEMTARMNQLEQCAGVDCR